MKRRNFFKLGLGAVLLAKPSFAEKGGETEVPRIKEYRTLGRTGSKVSAIGIGTARGCPVTVMCAALDAGISYIDTGEGYGRGTAENDIGEAIKGRDRKSLFITSKIQMMGLKSREEVVEKVRQSLQRLQTDYIDCLMMPGPPTVEALKDENFHQAMDLLKKEGKVRFIGVSHHGPRSQSEGESMEKVLLGAVDDGRFDVLLLIYNFLQKEAGEHVIQAAANKNIGTTIMKSNPLGRHFEMKERLEQMKKAGEAIDERMQKSMAQMEETAKKAESFLQKNNLKNPEEIKAAALKFVLDNPYVNTLNLTFSTFDDVQKSLKVAASGLSERERNMLAAFEKECGSLYCRHACGICESSCPNHVPVNTIMRYRHYFEDAAGEKYAMEKYARLKAPKADHCRNCPGLCRQACPYGVPIQGLLNMAHAQLTLA